MQPPIDPQILGEAADWLVQLQSGAASEDDHRAVQRWRARSEQHALAWQRAEALLGDLRAVPGGVGLQTLQRLSYNKRFGRRQALNRLGLLLLAGPAVWLAAREVPWQQWSADERTAIGEQKRLTLPDGTRVLVNTQTALDIAFNPQERRIRLLAGELLITTASDPSPQHRPFLVQTRHGTARALGTRFSVRVEEQRSRVAVLEGAVEMRPASGSAVQVVQAGEQGGFGEALTDGVQHLDAASLAWENGMLVARSMRLDNLLAELGRYRPGLLRCHPQVAGLAVSGAFSLRDTDASLRLLQDTLPVRISSLTRYWVTVEPGQQAG